MSSLIVTADDFGYSLPVNRAIEKAAKEGILKCASLMVTGEAVEDALRIARNTPGLQVGLHLALTEVAPASRIPADSLVTRQGRFKASPAHIGLCLQFSKVVQKWLRAEVAAQFQAFAATNLSFSHVDCHHHLQIHPKLFDMILEEAAQYGIKTIRIPYESWSISGSLVHRHKVRNWFYRQVFGILATRCREKARSANILSSDGVFGLYQTNEITEDWVLYLLERLCGQEGVFELYTHPQDDPANGELAMLLSSKVRAKIKEKRIKAISWRDLHA
jgi:hopanoid biosynthesis associated protein HpnK